MKIGKKTKELVSDLTSNDGVQDLTEDLKSLDKEKVKYAKKVLNLRLLKLAQEIAYSQVNIMSRLMLPKAISVSSWALSQILTELMSQNFGTLKELPIYIDPCQKENVRVLTQY
jgi:hypothetical protein